MKAKKKKTLAQKNAIAGYLFILPFIIGFIAFLGYPLIESIQMSLSEVTVGNGGFSMRFIGINNFKKAFTVDPEFNRFLTESISSMLYKVPATLVFSFFVALLLNQEFKGRGFVRAIFFLPVILSSGVIVGLEYNNTLLQGMEDVVKESGSNSSITATLQTILDTGGMGSKFFGYVFDILDSVYDIAIAAGIQIIIFLSGLQTISTSMYEAAKIEGCTAWESFWKITFPMVSSLILVNIVYSIIDFLIRTDNEVMEKINKTMSMQMDYGFSSAMAWSYFLCVMGIIAVVSLILSKKVYYYE
ncbi:MAG: sugar ABC transporter permease [Lachnospiraceae bacterium]|jgi:ABC-type sugar transport system permease subunit|nr:sugar ABC transporter permease [Lachnospiraceae bacterium]